MLILLSLLAWGLLFAYSHRHPIHAPFGERGGGGDDKEGAEQGIQQAGETMYSRGKMTPEEETQYKSSFDLGNLIKQIQMSQMGLAASPAGYQTPTQQYLGQTGELGQNLYNQILASSKDPYAYYQDTLTPQLQLTQDYINRQAQQRGLLRAGIPIEQMGRAGVELAIKSAGERMNFRQQQLQNAQALGQNIYNVGQQNLGNLTNLYGAQQGYGLTGMNRQAIQAQKAAEYQAYPYQAQLGGAYGQQSAWNALPGQLIGAAGTIGGAALGTMLMPGAGTAIGAGMGSQLGGSASGVAFGMGGR